MQANLTKVEELEKEVSKSPPTIAEIPAMSEEDYISSLKDEVDSQRKEIEQLKKYLSAVPSPVLTLLPREKEMYLNQLKLQVDQQQQQGGLNSETKSDGTPTDANDNRNLEKELQLVKDQTVCYI